MMGHSRPVARLALFAAVAASLAGCAPAIRSASGAAVDGATNALHDRVAGRNRAQTQQIVDSLMAYAARGYAQQLAPQVQGTVHTALLDVQGTADTTTARLIARGGAAFTDLNGQASAALRGSLNEAIQQLVRDNLRTAGREGSADVDVLSRAIAANMAVLLPHLDSAAALAAGNVTDAASEHLANQLNTTLRTSLLDATREIARTATKAALEQADRTSRTSWVAKVAIGLSVATILAILVLAAAYFFRQHKRTRAALDVVTQAVRDSGDPRLKEEIKARAASREVEPFLHDFLQERGYLDRRVAVPGVFTGSASVPAEKD
ncbi:MAG: hypothetical protein ACJ8J0_03930 [Longimicrobiaceae bacterium]